MRCDATCPSQLYVFNHRLLISLHVARIHQRVPGLTARTRKLSGICVPSGSRDHHLKSKHPEHPEVSTGTAATAGKHANTAAAAPAAKKAAPKVKAAAKPKKAVAKKAPAKKAVAKKAAAVPATVSSHVPTSLADSSSASLSLLSVVPAEASTFHASSSSSSSSASSVRSTSRIPQEANPHPSSILRESSSSLDAELPLKRAMCTIYAELDDARVSCDQCGIRTFPHSSCRCSSCGTRHSKNVQCPQYLQVLTKGSQVQRQNFKHPEVSNGTAAPQRMSREQGISTCGTLWSPIVRLIELISGTSGNQVDLCESLEPTMIAESESVDSNRGKQKASTYAKAREPFFDETHASLGEHTNVLQKNFKTDDSSQSSHETIFQENCCCS